MTKEQLHKIIFDDVVHVLKAAPGLSDLTRTSFATQAAVRLVHHLAPHIQLVIGLPPRVTFPPHVEAKLDELARHPADRSGTDR